MFRPAEGISRLHTHLTLRSERSERLEGWQHALRPRISCGSLLYVLRVATLRDTPLRSVPQGEVGVQPSAERFTSSQGEVCVRPSAERLINSQAPKRCLASP